MAVVDYDLITFGETMIRLSTPSGHRLETTTTLDIGIGGTESNVAIALARLGRRVAWTSVLPRNPFGARIAAEIRRHGVDDRHIRWVDHGRVGVYYLDMGTPPRPTHVIYDRASSAVALCAIGEMDTSLATRARIVHLTGITPALSDSCADIARQFVERAAGAGVPISFDVNYRSLLWSPEQAAATLEPFCASATILFCGRNDARLLWGMCGSNEETVQELSKRFGAATTVLTLGDEGALALTQDGELFQEIPVAVQVIDKVGAGDALAAGFLHGYLDGDVARALRLGVSLASLKMTIHGDLTVVSGRELEEWANLTTHTILR
jgi:2-dehydro-3-deoxygluconokinase